MLSTKVFARLTASRGLAAPRRTIVARHFSLAAHEDDSEEASPISESSANALRQIFFEKGASAARYSYFAERADEEGSIHTASLFRALSDSDRRQAHQALDAIDCYVGKDPTTSEPMGAAGENLQASLVAEMHDLEKTMPQFAQDAVNHGDHDIAELFQGFAVASQNRVAEIQGSIAKETKRMGQQGDPSV